MLFLLFSIYVILFLFHTVVKNLLFLCNYFFEIYGVPGVIAKGGKRAG
jgi:hypothetical protein